MKTNCDTCMNLDYDAEYNEWFCTINIDEDELSRSIGNSHYECPYYRRGDDYTIVKKQG